MPKPPISDTQPAFILPKIQDSRNPGDWNFLGGTDVRKHLWWIVLTQIKALKQDETRSYSLAVIVWHQLLSERNQPEKILGAEFSKFFWHPANFLKIISHTAKRQREMELLMALVAWQLPSHVSHKGILARVKLWILQGTGIPRGREAPCTQSSVCDTGLRGCWNQSLIETDFLSDFCLRSASWQSPSLFTA